MEDNDFLTISSHAKHEELFRKWISMESTKEFIADTFNKHKFISATLPMQIASNNTERTSTEMCDLHPPTANQLAAFSAPCSTQPSTTKLNSNTFSSMELEANKDEYNDSAHPGHPNESDCTQKHGVKRLLPEDLRNSFARLPSFNSNLETLSKSPFSEQYTLANTRQALPSRFSLPPPTQLSSTSFHDQCFPPKHMPYQSLNSFCTSAGSSSGESLCKMFIVLHDQEISLEEAEQKISETLHMPIYLSRLLVKQAKISEQLTGNHLTPIGSRQSSPESSSKRRQINTSTVDGSALADYCIKRLQLHLCNDEVHAAFRVLLDASIGRKVLTDDVSSEHKRAKLAESIESLPDVSQDTTKSLLRFFHVKSAIVSVIEIHPCLQMLRENPQFISFYADFVTLMIFRELPIKNSYTLPGIISFHQFRRSGFCKLLEQLEQLPFSLPSVFDYEGFCVVYTKFVELLQNSPAATTLTASDLFNYKLCEVPSLTKIMAQYIVHYHFIPLNDQIQSDIYSVNSDSCEPKRDEMSFIDFACFVLALEDIKHPSSVRYWSSVIDPCGDGLVGETDLKKFYDEVQAQVSSISGKAVPFLSFMCETQDMMGQTSKPRPSFACISLKALQRMPDIGAYFFEHLIGANSFLHSCTALAEVALKEKLKSQNGTTDGRASNDCSSTWRKVLLIFA